MLDTAICFLNASMNLFLCVMLTWGIFHFRKLRKMLSASKKRTERSSLPESSEDPVSLIVSVLDLRASINPVIDGLVTYPANRWGVESANNQLEKWIYEVNPKEEKSEIDKAKLTGVYRLPSGTPIFVVVHSRILSVTGLG